MNNEFYCCEKIVRVVEMFRLWNLKKFDRIEKKNMKIIV